MKKQTKQKSVTSKHVIPQLQFVPIARFGTKDETAMFLIAIQPSSQQSVAGLFGWEVIAMPTKASTTSRRRGA